jgi:hypothetical protein
MNTIGNTKFQKNPIPNPPPPPSFLPLPTKARILCLDPLEYSRLRGFGPYIIDLFLYEDFER